MNWRGLRELVADAGQLFGYFPESRRRRLVAAGPDGFEEQRGHPKVVQPISRGRDEATAERLWTVSEELTGVSFSFA